jgi:hypothetical protein
MASSTPPVNIAESTNTSIDAAPPSHHPPYPDRPRSTHHSYHPHHPPLPPPPIGTERKRNYGGPPNSPGHGGVDTVTVTDRDARQQYPESGRTGYGSPSATAQQYQQQPGYGDSPDLQDADTPGSTDGGAAGSKRRKTGRGSRGVAHLTPEQLERKRANGKWKWGAEPAPGPGSNPVSGNLPVEPNPTLTFMQTEKHNALSGNASVSRRNSMNGRSPTSRLLSPTRSCRTPFARRRPSRPSWPM